MRIIRGREAALRLWVDDEGGTLIDAATLPVLTVKDQDGVALSGGLEAGTVVKESTGVYSAPLPPQADLSIMTANWSYKPSGGTYTRTKSDVLTIVDRRLTPYTRYREDPELESLDTPNLLRLADVVEDWFLSAMQFPSVETPFERSWRVTSFNDSTISIPTVPYPRTLTRWTVGDTLLTDDELANLEIVGSQIQQAWGSNTSFLTGSATQATQWSSGRYVVRGTHWAPWGSDVPEDLQRAAVILARYASRGGKNYPERASQVQEESTLIYFSTPSPLKPTGLPEVDGVVARYSLNSVI